MSPCPKTCFVCSSSPSPCVVFKRSSMSGCCSCTTVLCSLSTRSTRANHSGCRRQSTFHRGKVVPFLTSGVSDPTTCLRWRDGFGTCFTFWCQVPTIDPSMFISVQATNPLCPSDGAICHHATLTRTSTAFRGQGPLIATLPGKGVSSSSQPNGPPRLAGLHIVCSL